MILTLFLGGLIVGLLYFLLRPSDYWEKRRVPHEKPLPLIGNLGSVVLIRRKHLIQKIQEIYQKFSTKRYFGFYMSGQPVLVIKNADLIKQIGIKDFDAFPDHMTQLDLKAEPVLSKALIFLDGQEWKDMRGTLSPAFTSAKMKNMFPMMQECNEHFILYLMKNCKNGEVSQQLMKMFGEFMVDVIATTNFGLYSNALEEPDGEFVRAARAFRDIDSVGQRLKFMLFMVSPKLFKFLGLTIIPTSCTDLIHNIVHDTIKSREEQHITRPDLIHLLNEARTGRLKHEEAENPDERVTHKKKLLDDNDLTAQALLFFLAGFNTSTISTSFVILELTRHQEIQKKLRQEVDEVLAKDGQLTYAALQGMKYLDQVVSETLRMWPPAFQGDRLCTKDFVIPADHPQEEPLKVEKGTAILLPIYQMHHDPEYFPDPEKFDPERFSDENKHKIQPGSYIPFGIGPRNCIGSRFALMNVKCVVFNLLANFELLPNENTDLDFKISPKLSDLSPGKNCVTFKIRSKKN